MASNIKEMFSHPFAHLLRLERDPEDFVQLEKGVRARLDGLARWSAFATLIILAGVAVQFAVLWIGPALPLQKLLPSPDKVLGSVAIGLIGFGVFVEYLIIVRAVAAAREIQDEADRTLADALARAGEASQHRNKAAQLELRAAEADKQARELEFKLAEAQLQLQRHFDPRVPDQGKFLRALAGKPKPAKIDVLYSIDEVDCSTLAAWICKLLRDAGWPVDPEYPLVIPRSAVSHRTSAEMEGARPRGITVLEPLLEKEGGAKGARATTSLLDALFQSLGTPTLNSATSEKIPPGHLRVVVAPKP